MRFSAAAQEAMPTANSSSMHFSPSLATSSQASVGMALEDETVHVSQQRKGAFARLHVAHAALLHRPGANEVLEVHGGGRGVAEFLLPKWRGRRSQGKTLGGLALEGFAEVALGGVDEGIMAATCLVIHQQ